MDLEPVWPKARDVKRPKPTYRIKTIRELSRRESLKTHLRKPGCLVKNLLHGSPSRISSPPVGHPTTYDMFVMDNTKKIFIHAFPSFQIPYLSKKIIIDKEKQIIFDKEKQILSLKQERRFGNQVL